MATKVKPGSSKGANKRSTRPSKSGSSSKAKKTNSIKSATKQHKPAPRTTALKKSKKPPHLRYTEKELKVAKLNGIVPAGVEKPPNRKKGKQFVDDGDGMKTILAMVMAEKEGNIESKMMRARQMEEVREARRVEAEKRAEGKKEGLEGRKEEIRANQKRKRSRVPDAQDARNGHEERGEEKVVKKSKKRVSFG